MKDDTRDLVEVATAAQLAAAAGAGPVIKSDSTPVLNSPGIAAYDNDLTVAASLQTLAQAGGANLPTKHDLGSIPPTHTPEGPQAPAVPVKAIPKQIAGGAA